MQNKTNFPTHIRRRVCLSEHLPVFFQTWAYIIRDIYYLSLYILPGWFEINLHSPCSEYSSLPPAAAVHTEHFHNSDRKGHKINLNVLSWAVMVIRPSLRGLSLSSLISERDTFIYWFNPFKTNRMIQPVRVSLAVPVASPAMDGGQKTCLPKALAG